VQHLLNAETVEGRDAGRKNAMRKRRRDEKGEERWGREGEREREGKKKRMSRGKRVLLGAWASHDIYSAQEL